MVPVALAAWLVLSAEAPEPEGPPESPALLAIRAYQELLSPQLGTTCRYEPTCSRYAAEAIRRFGFFRGTLMAVERLLRCNPFSEWGPDPVPETFGDVPVKTEVDRGP